MAVEFNVYFIQLYAYKNVNVLCIHKRIFDYDENMLKKKRSRKWKQHTPIGATEHIANEFFVSLNFPAWKLKRFYTQVPKIASFVSAGNSVWKASGIQHTVWMRFLHANFMPKFMYVYFLLKIDSIRAVFAIFPLINCDDLLGHKYRKSHFSQYLLIV